MAKRKTNKTNKSKKIEDEALCLLVKGQEIIKERWASGSWGTSSGEVCSLGAIGDAYAGDPHYLERTVSHTNPAFIAAQELASVIRLPDRGGDMFAIEKVIEWNDDANRRKSTVIAAFERAIKKRQAKLKKGKV